MKKDYTEILRNIDVRSNLKLYIPSLFDIIDEKKVSWVNINKSFRKVLENRIKEFEENNKESIVIEASFYDIITSSIQGNRESLLLRDFFEKLISEIKTHFSEREMSLIQDNIYKMLTNNDKRYRNFLGELSVINHLIKSGLYELIETEYKLKNKKSVDFVVREKETNKIRLIEVLNIHIEKEIGDSDTEIHDFLFYRMDQKNKDKGFDIEDNYFNLATIIWAPIDEVKKLSQFYKNNKVALPNALPLLCYLPFTNNIDSEIKHMFGSVDTIFDSIDISKL